MQPITYTVRLVAHKDQPLLHKLFLTSVIQAAIADKAAATKAANAAITWDRAVIEYTRDDGPPARIELLTCNHSPVVAERMTTDDIVMVFVPKPRDQGHPPSWYVKWAEAIADDCGQAWYFGLGARGRVNYLASFNDIPARFARFAAIINGFEGRATVLDPTTMCGSTYNPRIRIQSERERTMRAMMKYLHPLRPNPGKAEVLRLAALCWSPARMAEMCDVADLRRLKCAEAMCKANEAGDYGYLESCPWNDADDIETQVQRELDWVFVWRVVSARSPGAPCGESAIGMILDHMATLNDADDRDELDKLIDRKFIEQGIRLSPGWVGLDSVDIARIIAEARAEIDQGAPDQ